MKEGANQTIKSTEEPLRHHRTFGLDAEQIDEIEERIEELLTEPWDKGTGRPKGLSLRDAIMVTLLYKRQNVTEEVIAGKHSRPRPYASAGLR
jgi:hypothetical protein